MAMKIYVLMPGIVHMVHAANDANKCVFPNEPRVPYYWDENCELGLLRVQSVHFLIFFGYLLLGRLLTFEV